MWQILAPIVNMIRNAVGTSTDTGSGTGTTVHAKLGNSGNANTATSVFGRLNNINTNVSTINTNAGRIGAATDAIDASTVFGRLNRGAIRSIQRGTSSGMSGDGWRQVTFSTVTPSKCLILLNGSCQYDSTSRAQNSIYVGEFTTTYLRIMPSSSATGYNTTASYSWQVIEFY